MWSHLAAQFEVETIPGDHWSMLTTEFEKLGSVLTGYLREASGKHFEPTIDPDFLRLAECSLVV